MKLSLGARPLAITATAVLALLVLTGYTVAPNNLIVWSYLGQTPAVPAPYNASGVAAHSGYSNTYPDSLSVPPLPADFKARIALTSPEKVDICGGGGGGSSPNPAALTTPAANNFTSLDVPSSFAWTSQQSASTSSIAVTQSSGANLGNIRVTVSNFTETDSTGSGAAMAAMSTDMLTYALGGSTTLPSVTINFGQLTLPSGTQQVLVEVFSTADSSLLGGGKVSVSDLLAGSARLTI
jgi:hypothetical protein